MVTGARSIKLAQFQSENAMSFNRSNLNPRENAPASFLVFLSLCLWATTPAAMAACETPSLTITIPDGKSASAEEMNRAQAAVSAYVAAGEAYIECVDSEQGRNQAERVRNAMLDDMEKIAGAFNRQLRVFRKTQS